MRTLKKTLALVLVVAMMLSFGAIGANAAFTDAKDINANYTEAVEVLTGIKVIDGVKSGDTYAFQPTGTLTREQAAKIIAYMLLGPTNAELIKNATSQKFSDVETTRWSAGYIEYCANVGIILGTGDGKFDPTGKLTTAAFTKMLLCALGYKSDVEGFAGDSWAINVASIAITAGVNDKNIVISATTDITREQACQLAFLALKASMVQYTGGSSMTINGITITTGATRSFKTYSSATGTNYKGAAVAVGDTIKFCEEHFSKLKFNLTSYEAGINGTYWTLGTIDADHIISSLVASEDVLGTSTDGTSLTVLSTKPNAAAANAKYIAQLEGTYTVYYNGNPVVTFNSANAYTKGAYVVSAGVIYQAKADIAASGAALTETAYWDKIIDLATPGKGVAVSLVNNDTDAKAESVVVVKQSLLTLGSDTFVSKVVNPNGSYNVSVSGVTGTTKNMVGYQGLVKGDVVLYVSIDGVTTFTKLTAMTGAFSSMRGTIAGTAYTLGGTAYYAAAVCDTAALIADNLGAGFTFYLDQYGYVVAAAPTTAVTTYQYAVALEYAYNASATLVSPAYSKVKLATADGKVAAYDVVNATTGKMADASGLFATGIDGKFTGGTSGGVYGVLVMAYVNADGKVSLKAPTATGTNTIAVSAANGAYTAGQPTIVLDAGTKYLSSATQFIYFNTAAAYDATNNPVTFVTGNSRNYAIADNVTVTVEYTTANVATTMFVAAEAGTSASTTGLTAYILNVSPTVTRVDDKNVYTYDVIVNGAATTMVATNTSLSAGQGLYAYTLSGTVATFTDALVGNASTYALTVAQADYLVNSNGGAVKVDSKTVYYEVVLGTAGVQTAVNAGSLPTLSASYDVKVLGTDGDASTTASVVYYAISIK